MMASLKIGLFSAIGAICAGCTIFHYPLYDGLVVVGATNTPRIQFYRLASDRASLTSVGTIDTGFAITTLTSAINTLLYANSTSFGSVTLSRLTLTRNAELNAGGTLSAIAVSPDRAFMYYAINVDEVRVRRLTNGDIASSDSSVYGFGTGFLEVMEIQSQGFSDDGTLVVIPSGGAASTVLVSRNTTTGAITSEISTVGGTYGSLSRFSSLGSNKFGISVSGSTSILSATASSLSPGIVTAEGTARFAAHPTQPWLFSINVALTGIIRISASGMTLTQHNTTSISGSPLGLAILPEGDRLALLTTTALTLYSISSSGELAVLWTTTLSNAPTALEMMSVARS